MAQFSIFSLDGTYEYPLPAPLRASWEPIIVAESASRLPIYDYYVNVEWQFGNDVKTHLTDQQFNYFINNRSDQGYIYFRTEDDSVPTQAAICRGKTYRRPGGTRMGPVWIGVSVKFWMVEKVSSFG